MPQTLTEEEYARLLLEGQRPDPRRNPYYGGAWLPVRPSMTLADEAGEIEAQYADLMRQEAAAAERARSIQKIRDYPTPGWAYDYDVSPQFAAGREALATAADWLAPDPTGDLPMMPVASTIGRMTGKSLSRTVDDVVAHAERAGWRPVRQEVAGTGSTYVRLERGDDEILVRVSDHDGYGDEARLMGRATPHVDIRPGGSLGYLSEVLREPDDALMSVARAERSTRGAYREMERAARAARQRESAQMDAVNAVRGMSAALGYPEMPQFHKDWVRVSGEEPGSFVAESDLRRVRKFAERWKNGDELRRLLAAPTEE